MYCKEKRGREKVFLNKYFAGIQPFFHIHLSYNDNWKCIEEEEKGYLMCELNFTKKT